MGKVTRWLLAASPLVLLAALSLMFYSASLHRNPQFEPHAMVGKPIPALQLPSLDDGAPQALKALTAEGPVLVNFFASWCAPCEQEAPVLLSMKQDKVRLVGVSYEDDPAKTKAFLARLGDPYAKRLVDRDGRAGVEFGVTGVPETYLIGRDGTILAKHTGPLTPAQAQDLIDQAR